MSQMVETTNERLFVFPDQEENEFISLLNSLLGSSTGESQDCGVFEGCEGRLEDGAVKVTCVPWKISLITAILILFTLFIVISNSIIAAVIIRTKSLRKPSGFFKLSLALSQLIYGATYLPSMIYNINMQIFYDERDTSQLSLIRGPDVQETLMVNFVRSNVTAVPDISSTNLNEIEMKIFAFMGLSTSIVTVLSLLMISVDSFVAVRWPLSYRFGGILSKKNAIRIVVVIWISAIVLSLLPVFITTAFQPVLFTPSFMYIFSYKELPSTEDGASVLKYLHILIYTIVVWGLPFVGTWTVTVLMAVQSYKMFKNFKSPTTPHNVVDDRPDMDLIRTFAIILTTFTITILPIVITLIVYIVTPPQACTTPATSSALFLAVYFYTVGGFLNVLIYNFFHKEFRDATRVLFYDMARSMAGVFPCINSLLPFEKQRCRRSTRTSSFITTTLSRIRSVSKSSRSTKQGKSPDPAAVTPASFEMTMTSSSVSDSHSNGNK